MDSKERAESPDPEANPHPAVSLVSQALEGLAEALESLEPLARRDLQEYLELPAATVLRRAAADVARVVSLALAGLLVPQDPRDALVVRGVPWSPEPAQPSLFPPSTSGATTARRRS